MIRKRDIALLEIQEHGPNETCRVPYGFTDGAALPGGGMVFTAVADDTDDSYVDGGCVGFAVGVLDASGRVTFYESIEEIRRSRAWMRRSTAG